MRHHGNYYGNYYDQVYDSENSNKKWISEQKKDYTNYNDSNPKPIKPTLSAKI